MTDKYAVLGNPVHHSKSPLIHQSFAKQYSQNMVYSAELIPLNGIEEHLKTLRSLGFMGVNVTVPFKEKVWELIEQGIKIEKPTALDKSLAAATSVTMHLL